MILIILVIMPPSYVSLCVCLYRDARKRKNLIDVLRRKPDDRTDADTGLRLINISALFLSKITVFRERIPKPDRSYRTPPPQPAHKLPLFLTKLNYYFNNQIPRVRYVCKRTLQASYIYTHTHPFIWLRSRADLSLVIVLKVKFISFERLFVKLLLIIYLM